MVPCLGALNVFRPAYMQSVRVFSQLSLGKVSFFFTAFRIFFIADFLVTSTNFIDQNNRPYGFDSSE